MNKAFCLIFFVFFLRALAFSFTDIYDAVEAVHLQVLIWNEWMSTLGVLALWFYSASRETKPKEE